jgi:hypothetical protein
MGRANRLIDEFWGKEAGEVLKASGILNVAGFTRGLLKVAAATAEAPLVPSSGVGESGPARLHYKPWNAEAA